MCTPSPSGGAVHRPDRPGLPMLSRVPSVSGIRNPVRVPPRAQCLPSSGALLLLSVHKIFTKGPFGGLFRFRRRPLELSAPPGRGVPVLRHGIRASYQIGATQNGWCASLSRLTPLTPVVGQVRSARSGTHNSGLHDHAVILCSS